MNAEPIPLQNISIYSKPGLILVTIGEDGKFVCNLEGAEELAHMLLRAVEKQRRESKSEP